MQIKIRSITYLTLVKEAHKLNLFKVISFIFIKEISKTFVDESNSISVSEIKMDPFLPFAAK